jgi:signal transduction histidine kinase
LAIVQRLLELHGSHIEVASRLGQGSAFHFNLARADR